ncbi:hypothetical protein NLG97_g10003 [Lecanicillium saksenae]|uniref:Uncharacterized protein n=1 Tax=Lecanicillium saksenae TaxID=468837 RepID=A0ACC1QEX7_9HYPO|nr:hypothetical protein NLG97_g10003 [Lecanicillium saksenae]
MATVSFKSLPPRLRPVVRSYLMGYGAAILPQILALLLRHAKRLVRPKASSREDHQHQKKSFLRSLVRILTANLDPRGLATFCAVLAAGPSYLQDPVLRLLSSSFSSLTHIAKLRLARWLSSFLSAWAGLWLFQTGQGLLCLEKLGADSSDSSSHQRLQFAGNTIDVTLLTVSRALDVLVGEIWARHQTSRKARGKWTKAESLISYMADPAIFAVSCGLIMWSWFFYPERLPPQYNKWITSASQGDSRIIHMLRRLHDGSIVYGEQAHSSDAALAAEVCKDYRLPEDYGNPAKTWPFPCVMFHAGHGTTCEERAIRRFVKSWKNSMYTYLPLALAFRLRRRLSKKAVLGSFFSASRSSAFLATYITLSYYGVCLGRKRIGPLIAGRDIAAYQLLDSGVGVGAACALCGWSILVETQARRKDMALFVAPKALGTLITRRYPVEKQWLERLAFAVSAGIISACVRENPKRVRGWLGRLIAYAIRE